MSAANSSNITTIQILRSYSNTTPLTLQDGQLAYSFKSNTLFIGSNTGSVIAISDQTTANLAANLANSKVSKSGDRMTGSLQFFGPDFAIGQYDVVGGIDLYANNNTSHAQLNFANTNFSYVDAYEAALQTPNSQVLAYTSGNVEIFTSTDGSVTRDTWTFDTDGKLTVPGPISGLGESKLDFTTYGPNTAYLTTTNDDSTALFMGAAAAQLYASTDVQIRANTGGTSQNWTFGAEGTLTFPDNTIQTTAYTPGGEIDELARATANAAYFHANGAFLKANASFNQANVTVGVDASQNVRLAFSNTRMDISDGVNASQNVRLAFSNTRMDISDGVNTTQNTRLTVIENTDLSQNVRLNFSNTRMDISDGVNASQNVRLDFSNTRMTIIEGVDVGQNTRLTVSEGVNLSQNVRIDYSNTALTIVQGVDNSQNVRLDYSNTRMTIIDGVDASQNARMTIIEGTDVSQNARMTIIEGVDVTQNTNIANKLSLSGASYQTVSGNVAFLNDVSVSGNLIVLGNTISLNVTSLEVKDTLIQLGIGNYNTDVLTIGYVGHYNDGTNAQAGMIRDAGTKEFYAFQGYTPGVTGNTVNINDASFAKANIQSNWFKGNLIATTARVGGLDIKDFATASFNQANTGTVLAQASFNQANATVGVDATQNTRLTVIEGTDLSQNVRLDYSNTALNTAITIIQGIDNSQNVRLDYSNTAITIIDGVNVSQNARMTIADGVNASQNVRLDYSNTALNTAITIIQGVDASQNIRLDYSNTALNTAITIIDGVNASQNVRLDYSNTALNTAITIIQGIDNSQNARMAIIEGTDASQNVRLDFSNTRMTIIEGVDVSQNSRMTIIDGVDASQNVRLDYSNTAITIIQGVDVGQNSRMTIIEGVDVSQNARMTIADGVDASQNVRLDYSNTALNTAITIIQGIDNSQNVRLDYSNVALNAAITIIQGVNDSQNVRLDYSNSVITIIQGVDTSQNARMTIIEGVDTSQNSRMTIIEGTNASQNVRLDYSNTALNTAITIIQGVDASQNVRLDYSNTALNTAITIIQGVDDSQNVRLDYSNAAITIIQGVDVSQNVRLAFSNTRMDISDGVNASQNVRLDYSNTAITIIQGVDVEQNTRITVIEGTDASQNVRLDFSNTRMNIIDGVDAGQNARMTIIEGVDVTQNTDISNRLALSGAASQTVSGNVVFGNDVTVTGNLVILGNTISLNVSSLEVKDTLIQLGIGNYDTDVLSIGYVGHYNDGINAHAGFIRDSGTKEFYAFQGYTPDITSNTVNINDASFSKANIQGNWFKGNLIATTARVGGLDVNSRLDYSNTRMTIIEGVDITQNTNIAATDNKMQGAYNVANTADVRSVAAYFHANGAFIKANAAFDSVNVQIGVDNTQNTRMTVIEGTDLSQNVSIDTQNSFITIIQGVDVGQNSRMTIIEGVDVGQNTRMAISDGVNLSQNVRIDYSNTRMTIIEGVDVGQNTRMTISDGVNDSQNVRLDYSNTALNTAITIIQGIDDSQNVRLDYSNTALNTAITIIDGVNASQNVRLDYSNTALNTAITIIDGVNASQNIRLDYSNTALNTAITIIDGVNASQNVRLDYSNTAISATDGKMQTAYNTANNAVANLGPVITTNSVAIVIIANTTASTSNSTGALIVSGGLGVSGNIYVGGTSAGSNGVYTDILRYAANGLPWVMGSGGGGGGTSIDQAARDTANSASANTTIIQGVDNSQNVRIDFSNTAITIIQGTDTSQNARMTIIEGTDVSQNARMTIADGVDAGQNVRIDYSNTAITIVQGVDDSQNVRLDYSNAAITIIQGVDVGQNSRMTIIEGTDNSQNVRLDYSNTALTIAQGVDNSQNVRLDYSNTAITIIQGVDASQNDRMTIIEGTDVSQNARMTIIDGVNLTQNTDITNRLALSGVASQTVSGNVVFGNDVTVTGNLIVLGNTISLNVTSLEVEDTLIQLGIGNYYTDALSIGYVGHYNDGTNAHAGFIRDSGTKEFYAFQGYVPNTTSNTININDATFIKANIQGNWFKGNLIATTARVGGLDIKDFATASFNQANTADVRSTASYFHANGAFLKANAAFDQANVTIGVDTSQNARMTIIEGTDASQNVRLDFSNTAITIIQGVDVGQNSRMTIIEGVDTSQNARMFIIENTDLSQNVRLDFSNTRMTIIEGVDVTQNTNIAATNQYATSAFSTANNAYTKANNALANTSGTFAGNLTVTGNVIANSFTTSGSSGNISGANFVYANTFVSSNAYIFPDGSVQTTAASASLIQLAYNTANNAVANLGPVITTNSVARVIIANTTISTGATSGALVVGGGIGATGNLYLQAPGPMIDTTLKVAAFGGNANLVVDGGTSSNFKLGSCSATLLYTTGTIVDANIVGIFRTTLNVGSQFSTSNVQIYTGDNGAASLKIYSAGSGPAYANIGSTPSVGSQVNIISSLPSTSNSSGALVLTGGVGVSGNIYVGGTNAGVNGIYTDVLRYAANGLPWVMGSGGGTSSLDQYARDTANNASSNTIIIQGVDVSQNARMTIIEGTDVTQNTRITVVEIKAQAAFDQANTGGGGGATANLTSVVDTFTGNGYTTAFSLSVTPISINYTTAVVGGVSQPRSAYSVVGTTLTFTSAPENGQIIEVTTLFGGGSNVTSAYVENSNSVILVTNTVITGNCTVAANTGGLSVGPVVINTSQTVTVANNARWVIL